MHAHPHALSRCQRILVPKNKREERQRGIVTQKCLAEGSTSYDFLQDVPMAVVAKKDSIVVECHRCKIAMAHCE
jgi:hypothetical protein